LQLDPPLQSPAVDHHAATSGTHTPSDGEPGASSRRRSQSTPQFEWQTSTPEEQGMSSARLDAFRDELRKRQTHSFLVIRNDRIVYEWYSPEFGPDKRHGTAALAKALVAGLALGVAISEGAIGLEMIKSEGTRRGSPIRAVRYTELEAASPRPSHRYVCADSNYKHARHGKVRGDALFRISRHCVAVVRQEDSSFRCRPF